ncbi:hypothetical protein [Diaminobutyricimonas sp. TR449]|uniref:hypothetical protein n=1 Tax=Diaminobutyricimonas sp. TR449 TaxID=2708076 RepID=UPI001420DC79|nr:hypothetical protein [Diaminobutyricimonas sp. TR449]
MTDLAVLATHTRRNTPPLLIASIITAGVLIAAIGAPHWLPLALGAAGWLLALVLRQPVALIAMKLVGKDKAMTVVGWASGPAEELVRLALVLLVIDTLDDALWAGFGWATIEVLVVVVNLLVLANLMTKDDPKSLEAQQALRDLGMTEPQNGFWGALERGSATALHIGFTLLLFASPWFVLLTLPVHSVTNMLAVRFAKTHIVLTELALLAVGALALGAGLALTLL